MAGCSTNSFNGVIYEIPQISVDNFDKYDKKAYFLSHCHTDHTNGLFSNEFVENLERTNSFVYMSELSAIIIKHEITSYNKTYIPFILEEHIIPLKLGQTPILIQDEKGSEDILNVTLIPAGHCFGSVMFLFKINNKNILFTGDFRINSNDISKYAHFHNDGEPITINTLYLDTTFQKLCYKNFPKRSESVEHTVNEIRKWLELDDNNRIALKTSAHYGYEYVFNEIYKQLNVKVYVNNKKWNLYSKFMSQIPGVTNNKKETRIHLCQNSFENQPHRNCYPNEDECKYKYLHIKFCALSWKNYKQDTPVGVRERNSLKILFATHCSSRELSIFVQYFNPKKVVGFRDKYDGSPNKSQAVEMVTLKKTPSPKKKYKNKCNVIRKKVDSSLLKQMFFD